MLLWCRATAAVTKLAPGCNPHRSSCLAWESPSASAQRRCPTVSLSQYTSLLLTSSRMRMHTYRVVGGRQQAPTEAVIAAPAGGCWGGGRSWAGMVIAAALPLPLLLLALRPRACCERRHSSSRCGACQAAGLCAVQVRDETAAAAPPALAFLGAIQRRPVWVMRIGCIYISGSLLPPAMSVASSQSCSWQGLSSSVCTQQLVRLLCSR